MTRQAADYLCDLIRFPSVSQDSNSDVTDQIDVWLKKLNFETERIDYHDQNGVLKSCIAGRRGPTGVSGLAWFGHTDVVPVNSWSFSKSGPFEPLITSDRLYGRGSCDMKGSLACMLEAAGRTASDQLKAPVFIMLTADEEIGMRGARELSQRSLIYREIVQQQTRAIIGEPTMLQVVYSHKGGRAIAVTSTGRAAHSSTGLGVNANLAMIPFLSDLREFYYEMETEAQWLDDRFVPPTTTMNIGVNDHNGAVNITAAKSTCIIYFRPMPGQNADAAVARIQNLASRHGLQFELLFSGEPLFTDPSSPFVQELIGITGTEKPRTVAYGTDGAVFTELRNIVVLGPGSIDQAHTDDEFITLDQLSRGQALYSYLIHRWCMN
ncbi:MAG: M20 family metallopeptidase [Planctomyces sp.]|jgi:acetylornithine deacetylase